MARQVIKREMYSFEKVIKVEYFAGFVIDIRMYENTRNNVGIFYFSKDIKIQMNYSLSDIFVE